MKYQPGLVSVVIPAYNKKELLAEAIRSVLRQTYANLELLICDDGSTDGTEEMLLSFKPDLRVRYISGINHGRPSFARNRGICESHGEWIAFLDHDDEWVPDKLEKQIKIACQSQCKAICSNMYRYEPGKGINGTMLRSKQYMKIVFDDMFRLNYVMTSSVVVHVSVLDIVGGFAEDFELGGVDDYALWFRVLTQTSFIYDPSPLVIYRADFQNSLTGAGGDGLVYDRYDEMRRVLRDFLSWSSNVDIDQKYVEMAQSVYNKSLDSIKFYYFTNFYMNEGGEID